MTEHKQIEIKIGNESIYVDQGLEDIIENFLMWEIETSNSCIDNNGSIWIEFYDCDYFKQFLEKVLDNRTRINGECYKRETLWDFLIEKADFTINFDEFTVPDPNNEGYVLGTGDLYTGVSMRFPKELLEDFKTLFFEVFPPKE